MKFLSKVMEIRSKLGELHFERFALIELPFFAIYIHKIHKSDKDKHLHCHPWNFATVVLKGSYLERYMSTDLFCENQEVDRIKKPGSFSTASRNYFHKIEEILDGPITTLFLTWGFHKNWNYLVNGVRIESNTYRQLKHSTIPNEVNGKLYEIK